MKRIMLKVSMAVLMILVCGAVHGQGTGALSLDHVDGLNYTEDSLTSNVQITFHLRLENDYGIPIDGATNGFRVFSPNGAVWDATIGAMTGAITYAMCDLLRKVIYTVDGTTGSVADTVGFAFSRSVNPGIPDGFDDIPYTITIGPISGASEGLLICLDSAFVPPSTVWKWYTIGVGEFFPSWDGPHCYPVGSGPCCVLRGDVDGNGFIDISDLVYLVDYIFNDGPEPPCWDEGDVDGSGIAPIDISDLVYLADYMSAQGPEPPPCDGADPVPVYPGGSISLHEVDGLYEAIDQVPLGDTVTFRMRVSNQDIGVGIKGIMNGFRIYGDDPGVNWTITESGPSGVSWFDTHWSISEFSVNGSGADTLGYGGYTLSGQGIPDGLDSLLFYIEVYVPDNPDNRNQFLCIDSSFFPPSGVWKWAAGSGNGNYNPSWSGPHCFKMVHVSDLQAGFSAAPTAGVAPVTVQFTDESAGDPDDWYWDFGDSEYSASQDPLHTYDDAGVYDVKLRVQDGSGDEDSVVAIGYIQVGTSGYTDVVAQIEMSPDGSIPGNDLWYRFSWINLGTIGAQSCVLKMLLPDDMILDGLKDSLGYVMSPGDYSWVGDTIVVPLQTIQPSNVWRHVIPFGTLSPSAGGDIVAEMWLSGSTPDIDTLNNYAHHLLPVSDPGGKARYFDRSVMYSGDKMAHPDGVNRIYATGSDVEYLSFGVTFENSPDANLDISSITVTDVLDDHLDMSVQSLDVWGNSHPQACQYAGIDPLTRVMTWNCIKINLQPGEKGSFQYKVAPVQGVVDGTWVLNTAYIGFGFDDPITAPGEGPVIRILGECCIPPIRGDVDYNDAVLIDISDLVYLVDFMFNLGPEPICFEEGDIDGSGSPPIDISDLVYLTDYMFNSGPEPLSCP